MKPPELAQHHHENADRSETHRMTMIANDLVGLDLSCLACDTNQCARKTLKSIFLLIRLPQLHDHVMFREKANMNGSLMGISIDHMRTEESPKQLPSIASDSGSPCTSKAPNVRNEEGRAFQAIGHASSSSSLTRSFVNAHRDWHPPKCIPNWFVAQMLHNRIRTPLGKGLH